MNKLVPGVLFLITAACSAPEGNVVMVRFDDPAEQTKYLSVLDAKQIKHRQADDGWIEVDAESIDELKKATPEYDAWRKAQLKVLNSAPK